MPEVHTEIEIKLDADPAFGLPDLSSLPGVEAVADAREHRLEALYLDSDDLRLLRHGATLRRRTGGDDAGWHLKLPTAKQGRLEVRAPLVGGPSAVPAQLAGLVRVQLRGRPLAPVATLRTRRIVRRLLGPGDVVLAEVADDLVTAETLAEGSLALESWRELEVELVDGDPQLLEDARDLLVAAGARPAGSSSKLRRALAGRLAALEAPDLVAEAERAQSHAKGKGRATGKGAKKARKAAEKGRDRAGDVALAYLVLHLAAMLAEDPRVRLNQEEGVHRMRVATRRLRTALATFRPLFGRGSVEPLRSELSWLGGVLGEARDAEVMRERLTAEVAALPPELVLGPVQRRIDLELTSMFADAHAKVVRALDDDRYLALVAALEAFAADPPWSDRAGRTAPEESRRAVRKAVRRVTRSVAELPEPGPERDEHLHEVRKAAKRARYAAEAVRPVVGKPAKRVADAMEDVQELLGDHQDAVVERDWLRDLGVRAHLAGENAFTFGLLHGLTVTRAEHDEQEFDRVWAATTEVVAAWPSP